MSASHRSIARLPLDIFTDLRPEQQGDAQALRSLICNKLKQVQTKQGDSVTTVGLLLKLSSPALLHALDPVLCHEECQELVRRISLHCAPSPTSALDLLHGTSDSTPRRQYLPTGMPSLDKCLRGGLRVGTISELVGRAGVGKSQLALQLCIMAAKYNQGSIYIDTEKKLSLPRLQEMAHERFTNSGIATTQQEQQVAAAGSNEDFSYGMSLQPSATQSDMEGVSTFYGGADETNFPFKSARDVLANVTVHTADSTQELLSVVQNLEEEVLARNQLAQEDSTKLPVTLVVLDSIAAPTRRDFGSESAPQRVSASLQLAQLLKRLADQLDLAVVVINQVGLDNNDSMQNNAQHQSSAAQGTDLVAVKAALGTAWSHCLSTRLLLEHERDPHRLNSSIDTVHETMNTTNGGDGDFAWQHERGRVRKATVVKSNVAGMESMFYEIGVDGLDQVRFENDM